MPLLAGFTPLHLHRVALLFAAALHHVQIILGPLLGDAVCTTAATARAQRAPASSSRPPQQLVSARGVSATVSDTTHAAVPAAGAAAEAAAGAAVVLSAMHSSSNRSSARLLLFLAAWPRTDSRGGAVVLSSAALLVGLRKQSASAAYCANMFGIAWSASVATQWLLHVPADCCASTACTDAEQDIMDSGKQLL